MGVFMFPGQGSQSVGMGGTLFVEFGDMAEQADEVLGYSVASLCLKDPNGVIDQTEFTQPALYVVNAMAYRKLVKEGARPPSYVLGHSLGEFSALYAAGVFDFVTGLKIVARRGQIMAREKGGAMAAVIGLDADRVATVLGESGIDGVDLANINSPDQVVVSGEASAIDRSKEKFMQAGARAFMRLPVSGAFHSRFMTKSRDEFSRFLGGFSFASPSVPVISNLCAAEYDMRRFEETLADQINHAVRWSDSLRLLKGRGETTFMEVGPGKVLTKLLEANEG